MTNYSIPIWIFIKILNQDKIYIYITAIQQSFSDYDWSALSVKQILKKLEIIQYKRVVKLGRNKNVTYWPMVLWKRELAKHWLRDWGIKKLSFLMGIK